MPLLMKQYFLSDDESQIELTLIRTQYIYEIEYNTHKMQTNYIV